MNIKIFIFARLCLIVLPWGCVSKESTKMENYVEVSLKSEVENDTIFILVTIQNLKQKEVWIDKENFCFDGHLSSHLLDVKAIKNNKELGDVGYRGLIVDWNDELASEHFFKISPNQIVSCRFRFDEYYSLNDNFDSYKVSYRRLNYPYLSIQPQFKMVSNTLYFEHIKNRESKK